MFNKKVAFIGFYDEKLLNMCPYFIPTGLVYCATALNDAGWDVKTQLLEYSRFDEEFEECFSTLAYFICQQTIEYVCISSLSVDFLRVKILVDNLKKRFGQICIIIGGGLVSADPKYVMQHCNVDYGIIGEGEHSLPQLLDCLILNKSVNKIRGLCYHVDEMIVCNPACDILELDKISFPLYELFPIYEKAINNGKIYPILLSRSCPFSCTFCFHTSGKRYRLRSVENIFDEIRIAKKRYGIKHLFVIDELFGADKNQLFQFASRFKTLNNLTFNVQTRADLIDEEMLQLVKNAGCTNVSIGIESANNTILKSMRKGVTIELIENKLEMILKFGLKTNGNIIIGDIAETYETAIDSIEWFKRNWKKYNLNIGHIQLYPGTYIFEYAIKNKIINKDDFLLNAKDEKDFIVNISKMYSEEYDKIRKEINKLRFLSERDKGYLF